MKPDQLQLIALLVSPVTMLIVVVLGVFAQNRHVDVRISDLTRSTDARLSYLDARFTDLKDAFRAEIRADMAELRLVIDRNHSEMLGKFAELDARLSRIEGERHIVQ